MEFDKFKLFFVCRLLYIYIFFCSEQIELIKMKSTSRKAGANNRSNAVPAASSSGRTLRSLAPTGSVIPQHHANPRVHLNYTRLPDEEDHEQELHENEDDDEQDVDDCSGNRRSRRVAKLRRLQSSDDGSDEDYSPVKKKVVDLSSKIGRRRGGGAGSTSRAGSSTSNNRLVRTPVAQRTDNYNNEEYDSSSQSEKNYSGSNGRLRNVSHSGLLQNGNADTFNDEKRVVIKLNLNFDEEPSSPNVDNFSNQSSDRNVPDGVPSSAEAESAASNSVCLKKIITGKRKIFSETDESEDSRPHSSRKPAVEKSDENESSSDDNSHISRGGENPKSNKKASGDSDSSDVIPPSKKRKLAADDKESSNNSESSDSSTESEEDEPPRKFHSFQNGSSQNKKRIALNIGRKMPIYKDSLIPSGNKRRRKDESSEFECDDRESASSEYSEDQCSNLKGKKRSGIRTFRIKQLEREDLLQDDYLIDDDEFIDNDDISDKSESSSTEESDSDSDVPHRKKKKKSKKRTKGIVKSSAKSGKKIPLKFKPGSSSKKKGKKPGRGRRKNTHVRVREVRDGDQVIGTVHLPEGYESGHDGSYVRKGSATKRKKVTPKKQSPKVRERPDGEEVRKSSRSQRKIYYDELDEDDYDLVGDDDDLNVSSRGRVRRANTLMRDFI